MTPTDTPPEAAALDLEQDAKVVYDAMRWAADRSEGGFAPAWVERGNSHAQEEARRVAHKLAEVRAALRTSEEGAGRG